jgi:hypothetical protein
MNICPKKHCTLTSIKCMEVRRDVVEFSSAVTKDRIIGEVFECLCGEECMNIAIQHSFVS